MVTKPGKSILLALLVLAVLAAALPQLSASAASSVECEETYTVKDGERIYRIAREHKVSVGRLAKANNLEFPYLLTSGQKLCIPEIPKISSRVQWSATFSNERVSLTGDGFKKDRLLFIKVRENDAAAWYKLGATETDREGELDASFRLPKELRSKPSLMVCIKDGVTDALACTKVYRR